MADKTDAAGNLEAALSKLVSIKKGDETLVHLELDKLVPNQFQPRKDIDREYLKELSQSIAEQGVIEPIIVRKNPLSTERLSFEIICGEMRWRASAMAGAKTIKAVVIDADDTTSRVLALTENFVRKDLNFWDTMNAVASLNEILRDPEQVGKDLGKEKRTIEMYLRCHKKINETEEFRAIFEGQRKDMTLTLAYDFAKIADRIFAYCRTDKQEFNRELARFKKHGIAEAIELFRKREARKKEKKQAKHTDPETQRKAVQYFTENEKEYVLNLRIRKGTTYGAADLSDIRKALEEMHNALAELEANIAA